MEGFGRGVEGSSVAWVLNQVQDDKRRRSECHLLLLIMETRYTVLESPEVGLMYKLYWLHFRSASVAVA
jgi:hypothetical protein